MKLSQTMIVKNEENNIERALSWGKDIFSEQIVVDTGSTDRTKEIALSLGARVLDFFWVDDFSAAKNYALSQCNGDWIAILDADEYVVADDVKGLKGILLLAEDAGANVVSASLIQIDENQKIYSGGTLCRFLKSGEGIHYEGAVHETLCSKKGIREFDATSGLTLVHTGYTNEARKRKQDRNLRLIQRALKQNPENYDMLAYLGDEYRARGDLEAAEKAYKKALKFVPSHVPNDQHLSLVYTYLLEIIRMNRQRETELLELYNEAVENIPEEADFDYALAYYYYYFEEYEKAAPYFKRAIEKLETYGIRGKGLHLSTRISDAYQMAGYSYLMSGDFKQAVKYSSIVLKLDRNAQLALLTLLKAFSKTTEIDTAYSFLMKLFDLNVLHDRLLLYKTSLEAEYMELSDLLVTKLSKEEQSAVLDKVKTNSGKKYRDDKCIDIKIKNGKTD